MPSISSQQRFTFYSSLLLTHIAVVACYRSFLTVDRNEISSFAQGGVYRGDGLSSRRPNNCDLMRRFASSEDISTAPRGSAVPASLQDAAQLMKQSLTQSLNQYPPKKLLSLDLLTPGLNPKLENKAILYQEYLFDIITTLIPAITAEHRAGKIRTAKLMFGSTGEAAGFQKYCYQMSIPVPGFLTMTDLDGKRITDDDDLIVFVAARNNVGDPVINMVRRIIDTFPEITCIFLNCDLTDRVATGMQDRSGRESFRSSIKPAFYFRNIVRTARPSLVPFEVGAVLFTPSTGWEIHAANLDDIPGSGSLNRFMVQGVFKRHPRDPTGRNPPRFALAGKYDSLPSIGEIDSTMSRAAFLLAKAARNAEIAAASGINTPATIIKIMNCTDDAVSVLFESLKEGSSVDAENIAAAVTYLDASHGCVLQSSSAMLMDNEGERAKGMQKKEWSRDTTTPTTSSSKSSSVSPGARTSSSTSTDSNTDASPLIAKQKQSQRPGVFDINTGTTAYPVSSSPPASVSPTVSEDLQMSPISSNNSGSSSSGSSSSSSSSGSSSSGSSSSDIGNSRALSKGAGKSSKLTEDEEMLLNMLTSTDENGVDKGWVWQTVYTVSQGDDGLSRIDDVASDSVFGVTTSYSLKRSESALPSSLPFSTQDSSGIDGKDSSSGSGSVGTIERRLCAGGSKAPFPLLISTGSFKATGNSRSPAVQPLSLPLPSSSSSSSSSSSASSPTRGSDTNANTNTEPDTQSQSQSQNQRDEQSAVKCRVTLDFKFASMKYFNILEQRSASAVDAISRLELIAVFNSEEGATALLKNIRSKEESASGKAFTVWKKV